MSNIVYTNSTLEFSFILSMEDFEPLGYWAAVDCDLTGYAGCTERRKEFAKEKWGLKKAFGQISPSGIDDLLDQYTFLAWKPGVWNSYCFTASSFNSSFKAILNNEIIYESFSYNGKHKKKKVLSLMNDENDDFTYNYVAYGHITDIQIWSKILNKEGNWFKYKK